ncbi:hypothetical protein K438DRAFT_1801101 [Mycena galopus ATCC 62051]|nr:hypothetical protein K438DRAFT_1801101 [Mycena galopus ATCC 62051]
MSNATTLRARIEELSLAIETQKQVLRDLETSLTNARRDLNGYLDPMARLPLEISSEIFTRCLPDSPRPSNSDEAPMLFLNICHRWTNIAISTPSLWTTIHCESPNAAAVVELQARLNRTRGLPLSLSLRGHLEPDVHVVVTQYAAHVQTLQLQYEHLKQIVTPFLSLTKLKVFRTTADPPGSLRLCIDVLGAAPALVECDFLNLRTPQNDIALVEFTHPRLRHLRLGEMKVGEWENAAAILDYLTLPALETLLISHFDISTDQFVSFLSRSSAPLKSLFIGALDDDDILDQCFRLVPGVTDLTLSFLSYCPSPFPVLQWIETVLPNLHNLRIRCPLSADTDYDVVVGALAARRTVSNTQLQSFELLSTNREPPRPDTNIIAAFRQLVADGMHIHVGPKNDNYV